MEEAEEESRARENYETQDGTAEPASWTLAHVLEDDERADGLNRWLYSSKDREPQNPCCPREDEVERTPQFLLLMKTPMFRRSQTLLSWRDFTFMLKLNKMS